LSHSFKHVDSITINLASDYSVESLPKDVILNTPYGNYSIRFSIDNNIFYCVRFFEQNASRFPAADYQKFAGFMNSIYKADRSKIVFVKKED